MRESGSDPSLAHSPSFSGHSSGTMSHILAARVVSEFAHDYNDTFRDDVVSHSSAPPCRNDAFPDQEHHQNDVVGDLDQHQEDGDSEFEFAVPGVGEYSSPISADEIFQNGQIKPLFPVFNTNFVYADIDWRSEFRVNGGNRSPLPQSRSPPAPEVEKSSNSKSAEISPIRLPLKKLMISERETTLIESVSCSSSEADDLEGVAPETYCVWTPNKNGMMRKKSQSTGSSKRWKFRDLLYLSHSDGGDAFDFSTSKPKNDRKKAPAKGRQPDSVEQISADDKRMKKKATGESDRKTSYLVEWFANMNGLSRTVQPF